MPGNTASLRQALALRQQGRLEQAEAVLRKLLAKRPDDSGALYQLALLQADAGAYSEAYFHVTSVIEANPENAHAHALLGRIQTETGSTEAALSTYDEALQRFPHDAQILFGRGVALQRLGRLEQALDSYTRALAISPEHAELWCNHGNVLLALRQYEAALRSFEEGLRLMPAVALLHFNRANTLNALGRVVDALAAYDRALALEPGNPDMRNNRGNVRLEAGDNAGAAEDFRRMIADAPGDARGYNGLGMAMEAQGALKDATDLYRRAIRRAPAFADARHNLALVQLHSRNFSEAWIEYEHRCDPSGYRDNLRKDPASVALFEKFSRWTGRPVEGVVGLWSEQGIGDQVLFSTLIPELAETGQAFIYEVDGRLLPAYRRAFPQLRFVTMADPPGSGLTTADAALFCGSLPGLFRPTVESFARQPRVLLRSAPERVAHYRGRIGDGFRIALSWRSAREGRLGRSKSVSLADFAPFLAVPGTRCVDVQYGDTVAERAQLTQNPGAELLHFDEVDFYNDLDEVLAILDACDLLITTSNANAHLAAALGKPVWLMYPGERAPFHYWAHGGDHRCLWYPSVEIVSAPELDDWPKLIAHAAEKLRARVAERS